MEYRFTPELVLAGYESGIFPMGDESGNIYWFSPDPRAIFDLDNFNVPRSLRQIIRRGDFTIRFDTAFDEVIAACAERPEGTWISQKVMAVYRTLHERGYAHSVEAWQGDRLAGGLYGVALGAAFFGESMFFRASNASKVALVALVGQLRRRTFELLDTQWPTPHLHQFRVVEIPRREYLQRLRHAVVQHREFP